MKKIPKGSCTLFGVDKTLVGGIIAATLLGGASLTAEATATNRGGNSPELQQVNSNKTTISGTVVDETGEPMIGVSVVEAGTKNGVATDIDGNFQLTAPRGAEINVSYIGYKPYTFKAEGQTGLEIRLEPDANLLDEVVTIGYGTVKKRDLTGAVTSVKGDDITISPTANAMEALQGKVAGLDIMRSSGQAGATPTVQLRGTRSFSADGAPTYIIDGMPGDINTINPNDIESIEVLKDASSTAIYGSAGANGIIIVTTKSGKEGKTVVNLNAYVGVNGWSTVPEVYDAQSFYSLREKAITAGGGSTEALNVLGSAAPAYQAALDLDPNLTVGSWLGANSIDWADALLKTGITQNYSLSVSGGTEKTKAYLSFNFSDEEGQYNNDNNKIYSTNIRIDHKVRNWLDVGVNMQGSYTYRNAAYDKLEGVLKQSPIGKLYDEEGNVNLSPVAGSDTPSLLLNNRSNYRNNYQVTRLYFNPYIRVTPIKGLTWESRVNASLVYNTHNYFLGQGSYLYYNASTISAQGTNEHVEAYVDQNNYVNYKWENILTYNFNINRDHNFTVTGVTSWNHNRQSQIYGNGHNISSNTYLWHNLNEGGANTANTYAKTAYIMSKGLGFVGRINYSFAGKYLASVSVRRDGSSRLADGYRWDTFPAFSLGWRISDESFMDRLRDSWLDNLKIRVGYGVTGTAKIDPYQSFSSFIPGMTILGGGLANTSYFTQNIANLALTWEKSKSWNIGIDASVLKGRIELTADYYRTNTEGVIYARNVPVTNGAFDATKYYSTNVNICQTLNDGVELAVTARPFIERHPGDFSWTINATFAANNERITRLTTPDLEYIAPDQSGKVFYKGHPVNSYYHYKLLGAWKTSEAEDAAVFGCQPGDLRIYVPDMIHDGPGQFSRWEDVENPDTKEIERKLVHYDADNKYDVSANDYQVLGHNSPDWTMGLKNTFTYKNFDLSFYLFWRFGQMIQYDMLGSYDPKAGSNFPTYFDYWTEETGDQYHYFPGLNSSRELTTYTGYYALGFVDGSYFKVKNITLGYTLPENLMKRAGISKLRVYTTLTNPLVIAKSNLLKDYDPEMGGSLKYPLTKQFVFGLNLTF